MRIGFDGKRYLFNQSGLGNYSRVLVSGLAEHFPENEYLIFTNKAGDVETAEPNIEIVVNSAGGIAYRSFGIAKDILKSRVDVYHGLSNEIPFGLHREIPVVVTIHDVIFRRYPGFYPWFDRQVYHFKTGYAVKNAHVILATSQATADDLVNYYKADRSKIRVVYQSIHPQFYQKGESQKPDVPYFFYHSSFMSRKNHAALIEAFSLIRKQTAWNLILAGRSGNTLETCKNLIKSEKLEDRVSILEEVGSVQLLDLMRNASAFVYPSLFEGFGLPLAEAAACNLPMAVSNIAIFREIAENSVVYFHPNKVEEIAAAMMELCMPDASQNHDIILNKINRSKTSLELTEIYKGLQRH